MSFRKTCFDIAMSVMSSSIADVRPLWCTVKIQLYNRGTFATEDAIRMSKHVL